MAPFISGFTLGFSLILAIGAQNAFVLKQGLKRQHVFLVCFICALSDAILIALGISGFSIVVEKYPSIEIIARYAGALFLSAYAVKSFISSFYQSHALNPAQELSETALNTTLICLAFTWLNPHVYLDTVFLLGAISTKFEASKLAFATGAMSASFIFFFSLGYGAKLLRPFFEKPIAWKILEFLIGLMMLLIAISLLKSD